MSQDKRPVSEALAGVFVFGIREPVATHTSRTRPLPQGPSAKRRSRAREACRTMRWWSRCVLAACLPCGCDPEANSGAGRTVWLSTDDALTVTVGVALGTDA